MAFDATGFIGADLWREELWTEAARPRRSEAQRAQCISRTQSQMVVLAKSALPAELDGIRLLKSRCRACGECWLGTLATIS